MALMRMTFRIRLALRDKSYKNNIQDFWGQPVSA